MNALQTSALAAVLVAASSSLTFGCHASPTSTMYVKTNSAVVSSVAGYRTYSYETTAPTPNGYSATTITPDLLEKARRRIDVEMTKKGYELVPDGELRVRLSSGVRTTLDQPTGSAAAAGAPEEPDHLGVLVIDIFDRTNEGHLFHGFARDTFQSAKATDDQVSTAVATILAPLPARDPSASR